MLCIVRQPDGRYIAVHADRLTIETSGRGTYRFHGPLGELLELSASKVEHVRLVEIWPPQEAHEEPKA